MLQWAKSKASSTLANLAQRLVTTDDVNAPKDIYGRVVPGGDEFFHPREFKGIPVFNVSTIASHYATQLKELKDEFEIGDHRTVIINGQPKPLYNVLVVDVINRFIEFCHMIPASEDHHHAHTGGLLLHSLEASKEALRWAKEKNPRITGFVDIDAKVRPVMTYCAWLAALLHDTGKLMRDISVDAVEVLDSNNSPTQPTETIVSWHPARESLTDWANDHRVASYSVNFLKGRIHRAHNIDSSQILQPLLRGHYAMDYLLSTPIHQQVYNDLTRVLSGYNSNDDYLSEAVRMGDSTSTSRSLGFLYDSRLGNREISTAQRLFKSIQIAAKEWHWNRADGQGWIIGDAVYLRWSSTIENVQKVSREIGYSLPVDVKNVLNIMDDNHITDLFDRSQPDERIIRFAPGEYTPAKLDLVIKGAEVPIFYDLIKLRGPQIVFYEAPMPFPEPGIVWLPKSDTFYLIEKSGEVTIKRKDAQPITSDTDKPLSAPETLIDEPTVATEQLESSDTSKTKQVPKSKATKAKKTKGKASKSSTSDKEEIIAPPPKAAKPTKGHDEIQFVNGNTHPVATESQETSDRKPVVIKRLTELLQQAIDADIDHFVEGKLVLLPIATLETVSGLTAKTITAKLEKAKELHIDMERPNRKTWTYTDGDTKHKCVKLNASISARYISSITPDTHPSVSTEKEASESSSLDTTEVIQSAIDSNAADGTDSPPSVEDNRTEDAIQGDMFSNNDDTGSEDNHGYPDTEAFRELFSNLDKRTLVWRLLSNKDFDCITFDAVGHVYFDETTITPATTKLIDLERVKSHMKDNGYWLAEQGWMMTVDDFKSILVSEVHANE